MAFEYILKYYGVPAEIGRGVVVYGKPGVIVGARGHYIEVVLDGHKASQSGNYHPTCEVIYGEMRPVPKMTRSQQNYQRFLDADCGYSFAEFMGFKNKKDKNAYQYLLPY